MIAVYGPYALLVLVALACYTATTMAFGGNRNPANADVGGDHGRTHPGDLTAQAGLDHAIG
jgi:hypothetical protein